MATFSSPQCRRSSAIAKAPYTSGDWASRAKSSGCDAAPRAAPSSAPGSQQQPKRAKKCSSGGEEVSSAACLLRPFALATAPASFSENALQLEEMPFRRQPDTRAQPPWPTVQKEKNRTRPLAKSDRGLTWATGTSQRARILISGRVFFLRGWAFFSG